MRVAFTRVAWDEYLGWGQSDPDCVRKINGLIQDIRCSPYRGLGKPEPLKGDLTGWWSRRISRDHRLVYRIAGKPGEEQRVEILQCRYHY